MHLPRYLRLNPRYRDLMSRHRHTHRSLTDFLARVTPAQRARLDAWPHKDVVTYD